MLKDKNNETCFTFCLCQKLEIYKVIILNDKYKVSLLARLLVILM